MSDMWKMKDGTKIKVSSMSTKHLRNCIKMLERNIKKATQEELAAINYSCGDSIASDYALGAFVSASSYVSRASDKIMILRNELNKRGQK